MKRLLRTSEERTSTANADFRYCGISFAKKVCDDKSVSKIDFVSILPLSQFCPISKFGH